jgi:hypothetical protein
MGKDGLTSHPNVSAMIAAEDIIQKSRQDITGSIYIINF